MSEKNFPSGCIDIPNNKTTRKIAYNDPTPNGSPNKKARGICMGKSKLCIKYCYIFKIGKIQFKQHNIESICNPISIFIRA